MNTKDKLIQSKANVFMQSMQKNAAIQEASMLWEKAFDFCNGSLDNELPLAYMVNYVPEDEDKGDGVSENKINREIIWCFKNDTDNYSKATYKMVKDMIVCSFASQLFKCFGKNLSEVCILPIPCSTQTRWSYRWRVVIQNICDVIANHTESDSPINGYMMVKYKKDGRPDHYNKGHMQYPEVEWDSDLKGRAVVLLDDICASGNHLRWAREELRKVGANVVAAFVIGKTIPKE